MSVSIEERKELDFKKKGFVFADFTSFHVTLKTRRVELFSSIFKLVFPSFGAAFVYS